MTVVQKVRTAFIRNRICSDFVEIPIKTTSKLPFYPTWLFPNPKLYSTKGTPKTEKSENICTTSCPDGGDKKNRMGRAVRKQAQKALLDYFYGSRSLLFMDAENMSKNAPQFLEKLLKKIGIEGDDVGWCITRFLRYHPVNEFEPFFESSGLSPIEYAHLLPHDLMFLSDDEFLLENHNVLCNYGIARNKIGKIYKEATEIFRYGYGVLQLKLKGYEELGYSQCFMCKVIVCSPNLLIGDVNMEFTKVIGILKRSRIEINWVEDQISEQSSYNWRTILEVLTLFCQNGFGYDELGELIRNHPGLIFEKSGNTTLTLVVLQVKFGALIHEACSMFHHFPLIEVEKFVYNFRKCIQFLHEIEMNGDEIGKIVRSHPLLLGTCNLKKPSSLYSTLNVGRKRLCSFIQENPQELKKLVFGSKFGPLPEPGEDIESKMIRTKFLMELGYDENSDGIYKALKLLRGKASKLQERFDCLVEAGLGRKDVCTIVREYPQILNQSRDTLRMKMDFLVNEMGCPISALVTFPRCINYTCERIKLRLSMYEWLKDEGKARPMLALTSLIQCAEKCFVRRYVKRHPKGPQVWKNLKKQSYTERRVSHRSMIR